MVGDLLEMDVVSVPTYDMVAASGEAARMSARVTSRKEILVPKIISSEKLSAIRNYSAPLADINCVDYNAESGQLDVEDLKEKISARTAGVVIENPSYLGTIETKAKEIGEIVHDHGALFIVGINDPLSLGILSAPGSYGADVVYAEGQPLGLHMGCGGISLGILACKDDPEIIAVTPQLLLSATKTEREGELGFSWFALPERNMYLAREKSKTILGTSAGLHAIVAGAFLALMGPTGMRELAELIMCRSHYVMKKISELRGVKSPVFQGPHFEEFTVKFTDRRKTVKEINKSLLKLGIAGGKDISSEFPEMSNTSLYCVTETHTKKDLDKLVSSLKKVI
jgi:glycine dehydrogenase subunit 1